MGFLQVIWLILKILGILFASVIGLLLLAVVLLLFVPVRYRLQGHKAEDYAVEAKISWLLHLVRVRLGYSSEHKLHYEARVLWFLFLSNDEAWKTANEEKKKRKAEKKAQKQKEKRAKAKAKRKKQKQKSGKQTSVVSAEKKTQTDASISQKQAESEEKNSYDETQMADTGTERSAEKKKSLFARIRDKIRSILQTIKEKCSAIWKRIKALWQKADNIVTFLKNETNKAAFGASWTTLVQILKHLGPTKIRGYLAFGMEDPATTGYVLAILGIFYGKYGKSFSIRPNFEEKQLESEIRAKGRIRMSRLLYLALKLWKNKEFKSLLDNIEQLKSDTKTNGG